MVQWLKRLVVGEGNVVRERAYTNWNTLDVKAILEQKAREAGPVPSSKHEAAPAENGDKK